MQSDADFWKNLFPFLHVYIVHDLSINLQIEFLEYFLILEKYLQIKFEIIRFTSPRFKRVTIFRLSIISITSIVKYRSSECLLAKFVLSKFRQFLMINRWLFRLTRLTFQADFDKASVMFSFDNSHVAIGHDYVNVSDDNFLSLLSLRISDNLFSTFSRGFDTRYTKSAPCTTLNPGELSTSFTLPYQYYVYC